MHRGTRFYKFELRRGSSSFTSTLNVNENGSNYFTNSITMNFLKMETAKRLEMMALINNDVIVIFKDNNGKAWFLGKDEPAQVSEASATSGNAPSDANEYVITLTDESKELPFEVPMDIYEGIKYDWTQEYLTFETTQNSTNIFLYAPGGDPDSENPILLQVSMDKNTWHYVQVTDDINQFATAFGLQSFNAGTKIYVRGWNSRFTYDDVYVSLICDKPTYVYGNILSTLDGDNFRTISELPVNDYESQEDLWGEFTYFFDCNNSGQQNNQILSHPTKELTIPIREIYSIDTFGSMFDGCALLEQAPYIVVYEGDTSNRNFAYMFDGCSNLSYIRCEHNVVDYSNGWVRNVASNGTFVTSNPSEWTRGNDGIPNNWQVIKK